MDEDSIYSTSRAAFCERCNGPALKPDRFCKDCRPRPMTASEHAEIWRAEEFAQLKRRDLYDCDDVKYYLHNALFAQATRMAEFYVAKA